MAMEEEEEEYYSWYPYRNNIGNVKTTHVVSEPQIFRRDGVSELSRAVLANLGLEPPEELTPPSGVYLYPLDYRTPEGNLRAVLEPSGPSLSEIEARKMEGYFPIESEALKMRDYFPSTELPYPSEDLQDLSSAPEVQIPEETGWRLWGERMNALNDSFDILRGEKTQSRQDENYLGDLVSLYSSERAGEAERARDQMEMELRRQSEESYRDSNRQIRISELEGMINEAESSVDQANIELSRLTGQDSTSILQRQYWNTRKAQLSNKISGWTRELDLLRGSGESGESGEIQQAPEVQETQQALDPSATQSPQNPEESRIATEADISEVVGRVRREMLSLPVPKRAGVLRRAMETWGDDRKYQDVSLRDDTLSRLRELSGLTRDSRSPGYEKAQRDVEEEQANRAYVESILKANDLEIVSEPSDDELDEYLRAIKRYPNGRNFSRSYIRTLLKRSKVGKGGK